MYRATPALRGLAQRDTAIADVETMDVAVAVFGRGKHESGESDTADILEADGGEAGAAEGERREA